MPGGLFLGAFGTARPRRQGSVFDRARRRPGSSSEIGFLTVVWFGFLSGSATESQPFFSEGLLNPDRSLSRRDLTCTILNCKVTLTVSKGPTNKESPVTSLHVGGGVRFWDPTHLGPRPESLDKYFVTSGAVVGPEVS